MKKIMFIVFLFFASTNLLANKINGVENKIFAGVGIGSEATATLGVIANEEHKLSVSASSYYGDDASFALSYSYLFDLSPFFDNFKPFLGIYYIHHFGIKSEDKRFSNDTGINIGLDYLFNKKLFVSVGSQMDSFGISANYVFN